MTLREAAVPRRRVLQALAAAAWPGTAAPQAERATGPLRWLALGDIGGLAVLDAHASGPEGTATGAWLLDTGAEAAAVHTGLALRLGLRQRGSRDLRAPGGRVAAAPIVEPPGLCAAGTCLALREATVIDLGAHGAAAGEPVQGIVGWPTLATLPWRLEPPAGRWSRGDEALAPPGVALQMPWSGASVLPVVDGQWGERAPAPLLLDTGFAGALMLWGDVATALGRTAGGGARIQVDGVGGRTAVTAVLLARLSIGPAAWSDVPALLLPASPLGASVALHGVVGAVGMALFEHAALGFDATRRSAWTTAAAGTSLPGGFGVVLATAGDRLVAQQVLAGGPAATAGVRAGDELIALDGQPLARPVPPAAWGPLRGRAAAEFEWRRGDGRRSTALARERFFARVG